MSQQGDLFEPDVILAIISSVECSSIAARKKFRDEWQDNVRKRANNWHHHKDNAETTMGQLLFESAVVEYIVYLHKKCPVHRKTGSSMKERLAIDKSIPLLGPRFLPPTYMHIFRRKAALAISPETAYIKPITVVHALYFPTILTGICPQCSSLSTSWDSWNATGARDVYGLRINERAIGYQLRCRDCGNAPGVMHCFATTNRIFWEKQEPWRIPKSIPIFFKRAAVSHELYDFIAELRIGSTSSGLAESIKQLHLVEFQTRYLEYLQYFEAASQCSFDRNSQPLAQFSTPTDAKGYNDVPITHDFVTASYEDFVFRSRRAESMHYCKTRSAISVSVDNTFKSASKATVVAADGRRENPMNGGILSAINELSETLAWRYCMSASPVEIQELLGGISRRLEEQSLRSIISVTADNCCAIRRFIEEVLGPQVHVCLDVFHFIQRYGIVIHGGTKNPFRREVLASIRDSIIKTPSKTHIPATYWSKEEQAIKLVDAYEKWANRGGIWSAAAPKAHQYQLEHVRKGCLSRPDNVDIAFDGSRIEGSHKGWNSLQRAHPSGLEVYTALGHDHVHRRNIRIGTSRVQSNKCTNINLPEFIASLHGSHHVHLIDHIARLYNSLATKASNKGKNKHMFPLRPTLPKVNDSEPFGLVHSHHATTYGGLINPSTASEEDKGPRCAVGPDDAEDDPEYDPLLDDGDPDTNEALREFLVRTMGIEPTLTSAPLPPAFETHQGMKSGKKRKMLDDTELHIDARAPNDGTNTPNPKRKRGNDAAPEENETEDPIYDVAINNSPSTPGTPNLDDTAQISCDPSDNTVVARMSHLTPPPGMTGGEVLQASYAFMPSAIIAGSSTRGPPPPRALHRPLDNTPEPGFANKEDTYAPNLETLKGVVLPLPKSVHGQGLTRSQLLFSIGTRIDARALSIDGDQEFYLFMDMRKENQWTTFAMTNDRWAIATKAYNDRLESLAKKKGFIFIKKCPQALQRKLAVIEEKIIVRLAKNDFMSSKSKTETFWRTHCEAVPSLNVKADAWRATNPDKEGASKKSRKTPACTRCNNASFNHRKGVCSDGAPAKPKAGSIDLSVPKYPQPPGIFSDGKLFSPVKFLMALHDLYGRIVEYESLKSKSTGGTFESDKILEDRAFSQMLEERVKVIDGHSYFLLYAGMDLNLEPGRSSMEIDILTEIKGRQYLRLDCL